MSRCKIVIKYVLRFNENIRYKNLLDRKKIMSFFFFFFFLSELMQYFILVLYLFILLFITCYY